MLRRAGASREDALVEKRKKIFDEEAESEEGVKRVFVVEDDISEESLSAEEDSEGEDVEDESEEDEEDGDIVKNYEPKTFLVHPYKPYDELAVEYFNGRKVSKKARELVESGKRGFYGWGKKGKGFPLKRFLEWLDSGVNEMVRGYVGGGRRGEEEVACVIIFGTWSFDQLLDKEYDPKYKAEINEAMKLIWGEIPRSIPIISCFGSGVIANVPKEEENGRIVQSGLELESDRLPFLAGIVIPKVEGLGIKSFVVTEEQCNRMKGKISLKKCKEVLGITPENEKDLKGIAFFHGYVDKWTTNYNDSPAVEVLHTYLKANPHVAMAGGIHDTLLSSGTADEDVIACGFLVFGEDNRVRVSCVALTEPEMSVANILQFNKFKTTLMTPQNEDEDVSSFALMFGCKERGIRMHRQYHVESQHFHNAFPKTRLVGGFDLGEFYREIVDHHPKIVTDSPPAEIHFIHVSVFFLVSYRHPKV